MTKNMDLSSRTSCDREPLRISAKDGHLPSGFQMEELVKDVVSIFVVFAGFLGKELALLGSF